MENVQVHDIGRMSVPQVRQWVGKQVVKEGDMVILAIGGMDCGVRRVQFRLVRQELEGLAKDIEDRGGMVRMLGIIGGPGMDRRNSELQRAMGGRFLDVGNVEGRYERLSTPIKVAGRLRYECFNMTVGAAAELARGVGAEISSYLG